MSLFILLVVGSAFAFFRWKIRRRTATQYAKLRHRLGMAPFIEYVTEFKNRLHLQTISGRMILFQGRGLPHGDHYWVAIHLPDSGNASGLIEIRVGPHFLWDEVRQDILSNFDLTSKEIDQQEVDEFKTLLDFDKFSLKSIPVQVRDGFPCQVSVITSKQVIIGTANLAGLSEELSNEPTVLLMKLVLSVAKKVSNREHLIGWCDFFGNSGVQKQ